MHRSNSHGVQRATSSPTRLPKYLMVRGSTYYFKRRVPTGLEHAFPEARSGQVWKSLDTDLLTKASVMLEAELAQFNLRVANARKELADERVVRLAQSEAAHPAPAAAPAGAVTPVTPTPAQASECAPQRKALGYTLFHLLAFWKQTQSRPRTVNAYTTAVREFQQLHGALLAQDITREHVRRYRDQLIERSLSRGTVTNRIGFLGTLFRFGQDELIEHVSGNPFDRVPVVTNKRLRVAKDRRAFTVEELNAIFQGRVYTHGHRPKGQTAQAAYWAPLLGPFTGARLEEVAQLRVADIESVNGSWCIRICDLGEGQHVKTLSSYRRVPVHEELVRCGFIEFVQQQKDAGHERLFPELSNDNANETWSNALGKWFARFLDELRLADPALDYHSFRYTFKQQCSLSGISTEVRDALSGHWVGRSDAGRVYLRAEDRQYPYPLLVAAMRRLRYKELRLKHLYVPKANVVGSAQYLLTEASLRA